jgi:DNA topoisomerase-2
MVLKNKRIIMAAKNGKDDIEYEELDLHGAVLLRPDTYVGCTFSQHEKEYVSQEGWGISLEDIAYVPGLLRIFVEALSNVIDNKWRGEQKGVHSTKIKVNINKETGQTRVWNDGLAIPIQINKKSGLYNPEMIFGRLLTSSNYNDKEKRLTSGRNGLGIKLTNIFSICFRVKIYDPISRKFYEQEWRDNMTIKSNPKISNRNLKSGYTEVTWIPDFKRFGISGYDKNTIELFQRYIADMAMITGIPTFYNGEKVPVRHLLDYSKLYKRGNVTESLQIKTKDCHVVLTPSDGSYEVISYVNGVHTKDGGVHVKDWTEALFRPLVNKFNRPNKPSINIKDVRQFFRVFIMCVIPNPQFDSQSKTRFTGPSIETEVLGKHINALWKWDFVKKVKEIIEGKEMMFLVKTEKTTKKFRKIEGYDRANFAGGKKSLDCTLILCEGDSPKSYAVQGIDEGIDYGSGRRVGRDYFGIMPLRGKLMNVRRKANPEDIAKNKVIRGIIQALGVKTSVDYNVDSNLATLNYGRVMILADADVDGIHIQGLIFNIFHHLYPTLLEREDFMVSMQTPIVKVRMDRRDFSFYSEQEYQEFMEKNKDRKYTVKYYKGLGTSEDHEITETFGKRVIQYHKDENTDRNMDKVFHGKCADKRKEWLTTYVPGTIAIAPEDRSERLIRMDYTNFIDTELIKFSIADCARSIPHLMDGLKNSQRKILYACILKNLKHSGNTMKVAQLSGFVAENTNYHHGEQNLWDTIIHMAQNFVGSNNIPLLYRGGQFGSRLLAGKDAASARYIFTKLDSLTRFIFRQEDDVLLERMVDDGDIVEPKFYVPIIPMLLVNGCIAGIGTGWSCSLPCFNPLDIINCVRIWLNCNGKAFEEKDGVTISYEIDTGKKRQIDLYSG